MTAIHQFTAGFTNGDAISGQAAVFQKIFQSWGCNSQIFSEHKRILPELRGTIRDAEDYRSECGPSDIVLLHLSMGSKVNDVFAELACRKVILYHNITPAHFLAPYQKQIAHNLSVGRDQVRSLAGTADVVMAVSRFNANELLELGYGNVSILPIVFDHDRLLNETDRSILKKFDDDTVTILFVGRCAPNKKIEDILLAFSFFQKTVEPDCRFVHVGSYAGLERYYFVLSAIARDLKLNNVHFAGSVSQAQLNAFYQCADLFLCMSEHEGFCMPLIESMIHKVPVMAYAAGAIPETLDGAGVLFNEKRFDMLAEMMHRLVHAGDLRNAVLKGQQQRLDRYSNLDLIGRLKEYLSPLLKSSA